MGHLCEKVSHRLRFLCGGGSSGSSGGAQGTHTECTALHFFMVLQWDILFIGLFHISQVFHPKCTIKTLCACKKWFVVVIVIMVKIMYL